LGAAPASLGRRLQLSVAAPLLLFFGLTLLMLDRLYVSLQQRSLQEALEQSVVAIAGALDSEPDGSFEVRILDPESRLLTPGSGHYAEVQDATGRVRWRSPSLAGVSVELGGPVAAGVRTSSERQAGDGALLRVYRRGLRWEAQPGASHELTFSVAEATAPGRAQLLRYRSTLAGWFALLAVALLLVLGWLLRMTLAPMRRLEREISAVEAGAREQLGGGYPRELAGTVANLNALLVAERRRIARYRDSLGSLAHELKTPLAVMRASLPQDSATAATLNREIDRMSGIVNRQLARAGGNAGGSVGQAPVLVAPLAQELRSTLLKVHGRRDLQIALSVQPGAAFVGDAGDFTELLGNLLDNACKWCRTSVELGISVEQPVAASPWLQLRVADDGPGVPAADRVRILERGVRADERAAGHGIGLALVNDTVALYGGSIAVTQSAALGGACFEVRLPGRVLATTA
jgi:two-component system sensor histidine kinase PhoQ